MESCPHGNLCAALRTATKTTTNITQTSDDDQFGKETCVNYVSCSACPVGAGVEDGRLCLMV
jgi:hypothetical protein